MSRLYNKISFSTHIQLIIRSQIILNKASLFSVLAAVIAVAPSAAFAQDQVAGSNSTIIQNSSTSGVGNITGQNGSETTIQDQSQSVDLVLRGGNMLHIKNQFCGSGNQIAGANTGIGQGSATSGFGNLTGQNGTSTTIQGQSNDCYVPYYGY
jgi:hypothetical protein